MIIAIIAIVVIISLIYQGIVETPEGKSKTFNVTKLLGIKFAKTFGKIALLLIGIVAVGLAITYPIQALWVLGAYIALHFILKFW